MRILYLYIINSIVDEEPGGCRANYKQAVAEHVRDGTKTKDKRLDIRDINELTAVWVEKPESANCVVEIVLLALLRERESWIRGDESC